MARVWDDQEIGIVIQLHREGWLLKDIAASIDRPLGSLKGLTTHLARAGVLDFRQPAIGATAGPRARR